MGGTLRAATRWVRCLAVAVTATLPTSGGAEGWFEGFETHGFFTTRYYVRSPSLDFGDEVRTPSWRSELNLETELHVYSGRDSRVGLYGVFRPIYDAVYETSYGYWGDRVKGGDFDDVNFSLGASTARDAKFGRPFRGPPGHGSCVKGEFCLGNADTGSLFTGELEPAMIIDDVVFFGVVSPPFRPRGSGQDTVGGNADGNTYLDYLQSRFREPTARGQLVNSLQATNDRIIEAGGTPFPEVTFPILARLSADLGSQALEASLTPQGTSAPGGLPGRASQPLSTALNAYAGGLGDRSSLNEQAPFDLNRNENRLKFECRDNAHPWCFVRELYAEVEYGRTFARLGRQQIVWGKTDAFRLQDNVNPIDIGYHNVFPDLEERRIPQLALDVIQGFGDVGPLLDLSVEFAWVFDRFRPVQFGQCGEPYAFTQSCQARADAGAHSLFNFALARVEEVPWNLKNTEPGLRVEFRLPKPSVSLSVSAFYGFQDLPAGEFKNLYSVDNPNPAALLFVQGLGAMPLLTRTVAPQGAAQRKPWDEGFDPYDRSPADPGKAVPGVFDANASLLAAWHTIFHERTLAEGGCADASGEALRDCATAFQPLALPWTASEAVIRYPRVLTLGASADYQIPRSDTILRLEVAYEFDRLINDTSEPNGVDSSDVFLAAVGIDRPTYIRFLNPTRTAFLTFQTFVEHVTDYDDGGHANGMVVPETQFISTFLMQNFWRNDSLILSNFFAYDWQAGALITGPSLRWVMSNNVFFDFGVNLLFGGKKRRHNIRDLCPDGSLESARCSIRDPATWNPGQWQTLNQDLKRAARSPWFSRQGFADDFMEDRDEIWLGVTYQF